MRNEQLARMRHEETFPVFTEQPAKTYHLAAIVRGRTANVGRGPENTVPSMPHLFYAELGVLMFTLLVCVALSMLSDAPLKELANPAVPENPAKAPWYFLGLQELVSFSAFMGGIGIPGIVLVGLGLIPYLDRETEGTGRWFGGPGGWPLVRFSIGFGLCVPIIIETFAIRFGWLREWFPGIPQLIVTAINPATILTTIYALFSLWCIRRYQSVRAGGLALFTCFLCGFLVLTIIGTLFPRFPTGSSTGLRATGPSTDAMKRNKYLLLVSSVAALLLLAGAAVDENVLKEWRRIQARGRNEDGAIPVQLRQVVNNHLGVADRCVSCHVTMGPGGTVGSRPPGPGATQTRRSRSGRVRLHRLPLRARSGDGQSRRARRRALLAGTDVGEGDVLRRLRHMPQRLGRPESGKAASGGAGI